ncbi:MAG: type 1 glutamine amidotransferase domain-containing protein [Chlamydiota bacterium]
MKKVALLVDDLYEEMELWYTKLRLQEAGYESFTAGPVKGHVYIGKYGYPCRSDASYAQALGMDLEGVVVPGGFAPDKIRRAEEALQIVHGLHQKKKLVAFICHGGWVAISAKVLKGKKATGTVAIKDDLENAGAIWHDASVVIDGNLVSSRTPVDLPDFLKAILGFLGK